MSRSLQKLRHLGLASQCGLFLGALSRQRQGPFFLYRVSADSQDYQRNPFHFRCFSQSRVCFVEQKSPSSSSGTKKKQDDDRIKLFIDPQVQSLLTELTGRDLKRIFRKRKVGQKLREPKYSFMTEEQLIKAREEAEERADILLQMPPVLRPREPIDEVLEFDPRIQSDDTSTLIFTDISMNCTDRNRIIVARDGDGTLRQATWEERDKMNAIYFPRPGRDFVIPKMFTEPEVLQRVLDRASEEDNTYEYVLDRACFQFEPDHPLYISTVEQTYDAVDATGQYDLLKSTRHFGPMVFYFVRMRKMDGILLHSVKLGRVDTDAANLVSLFHIIFPECKSKSQKNENAVELVRNYLQLDAIKKGELELALNAYVEEIESKAALEEGLKRSHGYN